MSHFRMNRQFSIRVAQSYSLLLLHLHDGEMCSILFGRGWLQLEALVIIVYDSTYKMADKNSLLQHELI